MSHGPAAIPAGRASRAPRGPDLTVVRRAVARLTVPVLLLLPALIIIGGLIGYPLVRTIWLSFTETRLGDLVQRHRRVGRARELRRGVHRRPPAHAR